MSRAERLRRDDLLLAEIQSACRKPTGLDVLPKVLAGESRTSRRASAPERRFSRPLLGALIGGVAAVAGSLALMPSHEPPQPAVSIAAVVASSPVDPRRHAVVLGPESVIVDADGPVRTFSVGAALPFGVLLRAQSGAGASIELAGRADVRLDTGAKVLVDPPAEPSDRLQLVSGRIAVTVRPARRPLSVRIGGGANQIFANEASFGLLDAGARRWSAAVAAGEIEARVADQSRKVGPGMVMGAAEDRELSIRSLPSELGLEAGVMREGAAWIVQGLSDVFARVEVDGRGVELDAKGAFRTVLESADGPIHVLALDAAGRRIERNVDPPARIDSPRKVRRTAPQATLPSKQPESKSPDPESLPATTKRSVPTRIRSFQW